MTDDWTDNAGRWVRQADGLAVLVEPSPEWIAAQQADPLPASPLEVAADELAAAAEAAAVAQVQLDPEATPRVDSFYEARAVLAPAFGTLSSALSSAADALRASTIPAP